MKLRGDKTGRKGRLAVSTEHWQLDNRVASIGLSKSRILDRLAKYEASRLKSGHDVGKEVAPDKLCNAIKVYDEALKDVPSATIFDLYIILLMDIIGRNDSRLDFTIRI
ncbi:hypothetical protein Tco_0979468 [Tanacetum coccineum]